MDIGSPKQLTGKWVVHTKRTAEQLYRLKTIWKRNLTIDKSSGQHVYDTDCGLLDAGPLVGWKYRPRTARPREDHVCRQE